MYYQTCGQSGSAETSRVLWRSPERSSPTSDPTTSLVGTPRAVSVSKSTCQAVAQVATGSDIFQVYQSYGMMRAVSVSSIAWYPKSPTRRTCGICLVGIILRAQKQVCTNGVSYMKCSNPLWTP